jgi:hypothetical protein
LEFGGGPEASIHQAVLVIELKGRLDRLQAAWNSHRPSADMQ